MKKVIKKILIVLCLIAMICVNYSFSLKAYTKTGHDDFLEIRKGKYVSLLNEIDDEIIEHAIFAIFTVHTLFYNNLINS